MKIWQCHRVNILLRFFLLNYKKVQHIQIWKFEKLHKQHCVLYLTVPWQCSMCGSPAEDLAVLSQKPGYVLKHFWDQDYLLAALDCWDFASWAGLGNTLYFSCHLNFKNVTASVLCPIGKSLIALGHCYPAVSDGPGKFSFLLLLLCSSHTAIDTRNQFLLLLLSSVNPIGTPSASKRPLPSPVKIEREIVIRDKTKGKKW